MAPDVMELHPEVEEILREVAAQPGSVLLRVPRGRELRTLREDAALASPTDSALSRAERHLVAVYREEVAFALRQAAWYRMATKGVGRAVVCRDVTPDLSLSVPTNHDVRSSTASAVRANDVDLAALGLLEELAVAPDTKNLSNAAVLAAAHRLVPTSRGRILAGSSFVIARRHQSALICFRDASRSNLPRDQLAICLSNSTQALDELQRPDLGLRTSRKALALLPNLVPAMGNHLWCAVRVRQLDEARRTVRYLDAIPDASSKALDEIERRFRQGRLDHESPLDRSQQSVVLTLLSEAGNNSRRLLDAIY